MEKRGPVISGRTVRAKTECGNIYITLNQKDNKLVEVFTQMGHMGQCNAAEKSALAISISVALRSGASEFELMKRLRGIQCEKWTGSDKDVRSCPDAVGRAIGYWMGYYDEELQPIEPFTDDNEICDTCGNSSGYTYRARGGYMFCLNCQPLGFENREEKLERIKSDE